MTRRLALAIGAGALAFLGCATPATQVKKTPPPGTARALPKKAAPAPKPPAAKTLSPAEQEKAAGKLRQREEQELEAKAEERKKAAEAAKADQSRLTLMFQNGFRALQAGKDQVAMGIYQRAAKQMPQSWAGHYNLGVLYERQGEDQKAVDEYETALSLKPDYDDASANLTRLFLRNHEEQRAEAELRQRILAHPRDIPFRNQLVRVMIAEGRLDAAEAESKQVLKVDERNTDAMVNLATVWYGEKKYELAAQVLDNAKTISPNDQAVWNLLAFCQLGLEEKPLALESFKRAAALREDFPEAHNNYGVMLNEVNDCEDATRELSLAVRYAPDYAQAHLNLGNAYRCARRFDEAKAEYEKALALDSSMSDPYFNLAILYLDSDVKGKDGKVLPKLDRLEKSLAFFDKYRAAGGDDSRLGRYYAEAQKKVVDENARLKRLGEMKFREAEEKKKRAEEKKLAAEKAAAEAKKEAAYIEANKVGGLSDIDLTPPAKAPTPAPTEAPASTPPAPALEKLGGPGG